MRKQSGAIADLAKELEGTNEIMERLKVLLIDRNQTLEGEMAEIQVGPMGIVFCVGAVSAVGGGCGGGEGG